MKNPIVIQELNRIASENGGILRPEDVVNEAENKNSPLHDCFDWNDKSAAHAHRLEQARRLIRVIVNVIPSSDRQERVWVNLKNERNDEEGGYRTMVSVLSESDLRSQLLEQAMDDMEYFTEKYQHLQELSEVFSSMKKVRVRTQMKRDAA